MTGIWDVVGVFAVMASVVAGLLAAIDPDAKEWLAEVIERAAWWTVIELRARARAQRAARLEWEKVYRLYRQELAKAGGEM